MLGLVLLASALGQNPTPLDSVNRFLTTEMKRQHIPGLSVAILRGDQVLLSRGYGYANLELRVPASDSSIYQSGSLGKQFTAAAVTMLAETGRLSLDDSIVKWLPEGRGVWDGIRVRHLLTHTSGIAEYTDSTFDYRKDYTEDQLVRFAASRPLDFPPGERWSYSNTGYAVLGVLVHRVTGRFYGEVLHDLIFAPAGMRTTRIISESDIVPNRSAGYQLVDGQRQESGLGCTFAQHHRRRLPVPERPGSDPVGGSLEPPAHPQRGSARSGLDPGTTEQRRRICVWLRMGPDRAARAPPYWAHRLLAGLQNGPVPVS